MRRGGRGRRKRRRAREGEGRGRGRGGGGYCSWPNSALPNYIRSSRSCPFHFSSSPSTLTAGSSIYCRSPHTIFISPATITFPCCSTSRLCPFHSFIPRAVAPPHRSSSTGALALVRLRHVLHHLLTHSLKVSPKTSTSSTPATGKKMAATSPAWIEAGAPAAGLCGPAA